MGAPAGSKSSGGTEGAMARDATQRRLEPKLTGRCYCGAVSFRAFERPAIVSYCHCDDCRRLTGSPLPAFAGFRDGTFAFEPDEGQAGVNRPEARRSFCGQCGTPLTARFSYLPGQTYIPLGLIDQAADLAPTIHSHDGARMPWLEISDNCIRFARSSRDTLVSAAASDDAVSRAEGGANPSGAARPQEDDP